LPAAVFSWPEQSCGWIDGYALYNLSPAQGFDSSDRYPMVIGDFNGDMRKYISQLNLYCLMSNADKGVFVFVNKSTGKLKEIWMEMDRHLANKDLKKAMLINQHVAENTLPEIYEWNEKLCPECPYAHICTPDRVSKEATVEDNKAHEELLRRKDALESSRKEYEEISQQVKEALRERDKVFIGDYYITGRWQERKESMIKASRFWVSKVVKVG
jgi:hypothetical protein